MTNGDKKVDRHNQKKVRSPKLKEFHCRICGGGRGMIRKYGINLCRRCFKDYAEKLGFRKFD
ncbi:MAG: 30S ribosomal protein S14 [Candidatus Diapherotrites archaeon]|uniref:30S ribosomal protein S14 n=1 Tax=Candidatus Iainarchaeum sp. TaxID=3101447 RepID=A0A8T4L5H1_9ARCH|nr:30S ribosomal protein S14 [Candidatus Diapherotrites archaeon]